MQQLRGKQFSFGTESLLETLWINSPSQKNNRLFGSLVFASVTKPRNDSLESLSNRLQKCADSEYQPASLDCAQTRPAPPAWKQGSAGTPNPASACMAAVPPLSQWEEGGGRGGSCFRRGLEVCEESLPTHTHPRHTEQNFLSGDFLREPVDLWRVRSALGGANQQRA